MTYRGYARGTSAPQFVPPPQLRGGNRALDQASRVEDLTPRLGPRNQFDVAFVQSPCTTVDLGLPGDFRILVARAFKALDQAGDQRRASLRRKSQSLLQQFCRFASHGGSVRSAELPINRPTAPPVVDWKPAMVPEPRLVTEGARSNPPSRGLASGGIHGPLRESLIPPCFVPGY